jgi:hypothetical protein
MHSEETQTEPEATDPFHNSTAVVSGEEIPGEAIPEHRGAGGVLVLPAPHWDTGEFSLKYSKTWLIRISKHNFF